MAIIVNINGDVETSRVIYASFTRRLNGQGDARLTLHVEDGYAPEVGQEAEIYDGANKMFGGQISKTGHRAMFDNGSVSMLLELECRSWDALLDVRVIPAESWSSMTAGDIVRDIIDKFLDDDNVFEEDIEDGPTVARFPRANVTYREAIEELAKLAGFAAYIDHSRGMVFRTPEITTAPWTIEDGASHVTEIVIERTIYEYANEIRRLVAPEAFAPEVETFTMTGSPTTWDLSEYAGVVLGVRVDTGSGFTARTFGLDAIDTGRDYYWLPGSAAILQDAANTEVGDLEITYRPFGADVVVSEDAGEIAARGAIESTSGRKTLIVDDSSNADAVLAQDANDAQLALAKVIPEVIQAVTDDTIPEPGMVVTIDLTTPPIDNDFIIQDVSAQLVGTGAEAYFRYSYTAANVARFPAWQEWFRALRTGGRGPSGSGGAVVGTSGTPLGYQVHTQTITGTTTIASPGTPGGLYIQRITMDGSGGHAVDFDSDFEANSLPSIPNQANATSDLFFAGLTGKWVCVASSLGKII